jgi:hypothetical protein
MHAFISLAVSNSIENSNYYLFIRISIADGIFFIIYSTFDEKHVNVIVYQYR